jgi:hypothetical protein
METVNPISYNKGMGSFFDEEAGMILEYPVGKKFGRRWAE